MGRGRNNFSLSIKESSVHIAADVQGYEEKPQTVKDNCAGLQASAITSASGQSEFQLKSCENEDEAKDNALGVGSSEALHNEAESDCKLNDPSEKLVGSSSNNGHEVAQGKDKDWGLDKSLPPIRTRHSCDFSPSDPSPPSPKRMRQGSKEREDQWNGLWTAIDEEEHSA